MKKYLLLATMLLQILPAFGMTDDEKIEAAQYYLGSLYEEGRGVKEDIDKAINYFYTAAGNKDKDALEDLEAFAVKNNSLAQYYLGVLYQNGKGVKKDIDKAIDYFYAAAGNEEPRALNALENFADTDNNLKAVKFLVDMYYEGKGVEKDLEKVAEYDLKAARTSATERKAVLESIVPGSKYEGLIKQSECEYLNNRKGSLEDSVGRIALFRGIHYVTNLFDADAITQHASLDDVDVFLVSSAACSLTGQKFLAGIPGDPELKAGKLICKILNKFKAESEILYNKFHETYTNNHEQFHKFLGDPDGARDSLTQKAFTQYRWIFQNFAEKEYPNTWRRAVKRNPFVSFACNAKHGLKYALGQKSFTGGEDVKLSPEYDKKGMPKNKYLGKLYTAILSPAELWKLNPTFVVDKHAKNKVKISTNHGNNILTENEVSFFGYVPKDLVKSATVLEIGPLLGDDKKDYKAIDQNFHAKKGKAKQLVKTMFPDYEKQANKLIRKQDYLRLYPDIFENFYTHISDASAVIRAANWLHSINEKKVDIASFPSLDGGGATVNSMYMLATNLTRQPFNLVEKWASSLKKIYISFCALKNSGSSFVQILNNNNISRLQELSLVSCQLTQDDTEQIAGCLAGKGPLMVLMLDDNAVGNRGAKKFAASLKKNSTLTRLSLCNTGITNIACFAELFPIGGQKESHNTTLRELKLDFSLKEEDLKILKEKRRIALEEQYPKNLKEIQKGLTRNFK